MAHTVFLFELMEEIRQWPIEDLAEGGNNRRSGSVAPSRQQIFAVFTHKKTLILAHFSIEKGHAVSAVTSIDNAKIFSQLTCESRPAG